MSTPNDRPAPPTGPAPADAAAAGRSVDPTLGPALLQAPWRLSYLEGLKETDKRPADSSSCFLTEYWKAPAEDQKNHVIVRTNVGMILLNAFPYANGHLLVALGEGRARLLDYGPAERAHLWQLVDAAAELVETALAPQGVNIGINQGRAAGAGVPGHLHVHLVPRWSGDVNFFTVVARTRVIPGSLDAMAARYRGAWETIRGKWLAK